MKKFAIVLFAFLASSVDALYASSSESSKGLDVEEVPKIVVSKGGTACEVVPQASTNGIQVFVNGVLGATFEFGDDGLLAAFTFRDQRFTAGYSGEGASRVLTHALAANGAVTTITRSPRSIARPTIQMPTRNEMVARVCEMLVSRAKTINERMFTPSTDELQLVVPRAKMTNDEMFTAYTDELFWDDYFFNWSLHLRDPFADVFGSIVRGALNVKRSLNSVSGIATIFSKWNRSVLNPGGWG